MFKYFKILHKKFNRISIIVILGSCLILVATSFAQSADCLPTKPDSLGPYYKPGSPERSSVGKGYLLEGVVKSSSDCSPVLGAKIEFWMTGPGGDYDDNHRATVYSNSNGKYSFESNFPKDYLWRPPHIHIQITVDGFKKLITQHYPQKGNTKDTFDLVLIPAKK